MEAIRTALIGCGGMGQRHALGFEALGRAVKPAVDVVAVCDTDSANAARLAAEVERISGRRPAIYGRVDDVAADASIDAADVVTDAASHYAVALPLLQAGKHVLCEKPLALTVRSCRALVDAAHAAGVVLATAENYRRDPMNRLAKAVLDAGLLGQVHVLVQQAIGGNDEIIITPWRHMKNSGAIGLDMGAHYADIVQYYLGEIDTVYGRGLIAEPVRHRRAAPELDLESYRARFQAMPERIVPTGEDSVIALLRLRSGVTASLIYVPSGPGHSYWQRSVHGRAGSIQIPGDRSGGEVALYRADGVLRGTQLLAELEGFALDDTTAALFGADTVSYQLPGSTVDAALLAIELQDFGQAVQQGRAAEVDGWAGTTAVAAVLAAYESDRLGRSVSMAEVLDGSVSGYQDEIDAGLGLA
jgi:predicted dehydrogenase